MQSVADYRVHWYQSLEKVRCGLRQTCGSFDLPNNMKIGSDVFLADAGNYFESEQGLCSGTRGPAIALPIPISGKQTINTSMISALSTGLTLPNPDIMRIWRLQSTGGNCGKDRLSRIVHTPEDIFLK